MRCLDDRVDASRASRDVGAGLRLTMARRSWPWTVVAPAAFLFLLPITHTTPLRIACLVLSLLTAVVTAFVANGAARSARRPPTYLVVALVYWFVVCLAASFHSIEPAYSWGEFRNEVLSTLLAFGAFYVLTDREAALRGWRIALLASFAFAATVAVISYLAGTDWGRAGSRSATATRLSTYVVLIVPLLLERWYAQGPGRARIVYAAAVVLALAGGAFTQNRNMWFGVAAEIVVFAALAWFRLTRDVRARLRRRLIVATLAGAVLFVGAMAYVVQQKAIVSNTSTEEQARFDRDPRFEIWVYASQRIAERPWFGYGYGRGILRSVFRMHFDNPLKWHGHNVLVDYLMEAGVFGGIAIVGLFAAFVARSVQIYRTDDPVLWPVGAWTLAMLAGINA